MDFFQSHPAAINEAMQKGEIDAAPVSALEYFQRQNDYLLLSELAIGTRLFARSVLLLSHKKIEELDGAKVALSRESLSSAGLLRILLKKRYGHNNTFEVADQDPEVMLRNYPAALVIGDQALFCQPKELIYKYDLGESWYTWTGKPFVFALWAVRKDFAAKHPGPIRSFCALLKETLLDNLANLENILEHSFGITPSDKRFCQTIGYLVNLQYQLDKTMKEGVEHFFELAHAEGLTPAPQPLRFFE